MSDPEIIVIGGGVSGLSCALEVARTGRRIEIWTRDEPEQTTSMIAAAFWYPYRVEPLARVVPWAAQSYERFGSLALDASVAHVAGIHMREATELFPEPVPDPAWARHVDHFRQLWPEELPPGYGHGIAFTAPVIEMPHYLPWLVARARNAGVELHTRELASLDEALAHAEIVINCAGLGARELVPDPRVYPVRGQIVHHSRGELERVFIDEHGPHGITYVVPRGEDVILGGVSEDHVESLAVDPAQTEAIVARCTRLVPRLADTHQLGVAVGLRPCRDEVRLEAEAVGDKLVVHNYGHGGAGVTLSWGCALEVADLVRAHIAEQRRG